MSGIDSIQAIRIDITQKSAAIQVRMLASTCFFILGFQLSQQVSDWLLASKKVSALELIEQLNQHQESLWPAKALDILGISQDGQEQILNKPIFKKARLLAQAASNLTFANAVSKVGVTTFGAVSVIVGEAVSGGYDLYAHPQKPVGQVLGNVAAGSIGAIQGLQNGLILGGQLGAIAGPGGMAIGSVIGGAAGSILGSRVGKWLLPWNWSRKQEKE